MNLTKLDWIVIVILGMMLLTHFVTSYAIEYYRTCGDYHIAADKLVKVVEGNPAAWSILAMGKIGVLIKIVAVASLFGMWFAFIRKIQFHEKLKYAAHYFITTLFFFSLYMVVNDLGHLLGLLV